MEEKTVYIDGFGWVGAEDIKIKIELLVGGLMEIIQDINTDKKELDDKIKELEDEISDLEFENDDLEERIEMLESNLEEMEEN